MRSLLEEQDPNAVPIWTVGSEEYPQWLAARPAAMRRWLQDSQFQPEPYRVALLPGERGELAGVVLGLGGGAPGLWSFAGLSRQLPGDRRYRYASELEAPVATKAALAWAISDYDFDRYRSEAAQRKPAQLVLPSGCDRAHVKRAAAATWLVRDLINTPAGDLGPEELAAEAEALGRRCGAEFSQLTGDELLARGLGAIHAVGRASSRAPRLIDLRWGEADRPLVTLVGKGVCFDSGGLDIKNAQGMLLMKKDMGGAAHALALAQMIMQAQLPVRLRVLLPAVDNAIAGNAYRPGDVLRTYKGISVEIGNTDAEGRLILCDALALADEDSPQLLIDMATLTGAARVALGVDVPALYSSRDEDADGLLRHAAAQDDPLWRMPLWAGYQEDLASKIADVNHVPSHGFAGSIAAALFLQRFVTRAPGWLHLDIYAWNARERPGRPVGGEAQGLRALYSWLAQRYPG